jgi:glycosyltransferase involved in cell wall biosynthesis
MNQKKTSPFISVIMITYNHEDYIEESLLSVLNQQSDQFYLEILIVDDGSSDNTKQIILRIQAAYPKVVFPTFKEHMGATAINKNLNEQIKKARGEYITFLAGDDCYINAGLKKQLIVFEKGIEAIFAEGRNFSVEKCTYLGRCQEKIIVNMLKENRLKDIYQYITSHVPQLYIQGLMIKKEILEKINYFDEKIIADDWVLNIKLFKYVSENHLVIRYLNEEVFKRNIIKNSTSNNHEVHFKRILQVIQKYIPRNHKEAMLKHLYLTYSVKYAAEGDFVKSSKFFIKFFLKDMFLIFLFKKLTQRLIVILRINYRHYLSEK